MELTPEKFEKAEFAERRRGYDIDQVESFLEETGTEFAQMLAKFRHTEQRAAAAEARIAEGEAKLSEVNRVLEEADQRVRRAEDAARAARSEAESIRNSAAAEGARNAQADEDAEVERVAKTLVIAQRTADATIHDAQAKADSLLAEARESAERQVAEANIEAGKLAAEARMRADEEFADRHAAALKAVTELEGRRSQIEGVILQLESRISNYREDIQRTAAELNSLAEDPAAMGPREGISIHPDEVITSFDPIDESQPVATVDDDFVSGETNAATEPESFSAGTSEDGGSSVQAQSAQSAESAQIVEPSAAVETSDYTSTATPEAYLDLTSASGSVNGSGAGSDDWGPGSWSELQATLEDEPSEERQRVSASAITTSASTSSTIAVNSVGATAISPERDRDHVDDRPTQAVDRADLPRDRYLEELDHAVNTSEDSDDEALAAFLDGGVDSKARRFGWRR